MNKKIILSKVKNTLCFLLLVLSVLLGSTDAFGKTYTNFRGVKKALKEQVFLDLNKTENLHSIGTLYCGCDWDWRGESGGSINSSSCPYEIRKNKVRGERIEYEHILPISTASADHKCWADGYGRGGGRQHCEKTDSEWRIMNADPRNLHLAIGEVNADRSNYPMAEVDYGYTYGQCMTTINFEQKLIEPRNEVKGYIARVYFYMIDKYSLQKTVFGRQPHLEATLIKWNKEYPVADWEIELEKRLYKLTGERNFYATGQREWQ